MKRCLLIVVIFLLAGAVVNVAVAWAFGLRIVLITGGVTESGALWAVDGATRCRRFENHEWEAFWKVKPNVPSVRQRGSFGFECRLSGRIVRVYSGFFPTESGNTLRASEHVQVIQLRCGLPMRSLMHEITSINYQVLNSSTMGRFRSEQLPVIPIWPGFAINTIVYATILWLLILGPFVLRRFIRVQRGRCVKCGYPMGESGVCSECGKALPGRAKMAT